MDGIAKDVEVFIKAREPSEFIDLPHDGIKLTLVVCAFGTINKNESKIVTIPVDTSAMRGTNETRIEAVIYTSSYNMNKGSNKDTLYVPLNTFDNGETAMITQSPSYLYFLTIVIVIFIVIIFVAVVIVFLCIYFYSENIMNWP